MRRAAELFRLRELLLLLVVKELRLKYKGTVLGFLWSVLNPVLMMLVYAVVFTLIARFSIERYPIFLLSGLLPWAAFTGAIASATTAITSNGGLVRRVAFPLELLPLTAVLSNLFNLVLSLGILLVFCLFYRQPLGWPLLSLPVILLLQGALSTGLALVLAAVTVYFRDVEHLTGIALTLLFFLTPIVYPLAAINNEAFHQALLLNPLTWLFASYQRVWHDNAWPDPIQLLALAGAAALAATLGVLVFGRLEGRLAEEV
jgi:ABC-2 type transport system permease protein